MCTLSTCYNLWNCNSANTYVIKENQKKAFKILLLGSLKGLKYLNILMRTQ